MLPYPVEPGLRCVKSTSLPKPKSTHKSSLDLPQCKEKHPPTLAFKNLLPHIYQKSIYKVGSTAIIILNVKSPNPNPNPRWYTSIKNQL
jgi:hypothetical protein